MSFIEVSGISKLQQGNSILSGISFRQNKMQRLAIAGETGSGKSTLLKIIGGHQQADAGTVTFEGKKVLGPEEKLLPGHPRIAYLSQHFELLNNYRVEELLGYANQLSDAEAHRLFDICRITHLLPRKTDQLSGGERQRIALAKLLITAPSLLLLDEPYSNLDTPHKNILKRVIEDLSETLQITCILVSHDPVDLLSWADEIIFLQKGKLIQKGSPQEVYLQPVNAYAAGLTGAYNLLSFEVASRVFPAFAKQGAALLFRPEQVVVSKEDEGEHPGIIRSVSFCGPYDEIIVELSQILVTARCRPGEFNNGDAVHLSLPANLHYIPEGV